MRYKNNNETLVGWADGPPLCTQPTGLTLGVNGALRCANTPY